MDAKKPTVGLGLLIPAKGDKMPESVPPPAGEEDSEAEDMAAAGVMSALESKDTAAFKEALKTFIQACDKD